MSDFKRVGEIETAVCCFRYLPETVRAMSPEDQDQVQQALQQRIERSGKAFFPSTILHGRRALRVNINSYLTEQRHIDDLVELLHEEGARELEHSDTKAVNMTRRNYLLGLVAALMLGTSVRAQESR